MIYFPPPTKGYIKALELMTWCKRQEKLVATDYIERMWAAAIAACLDAKDDQIKRLIAKIENDWGCPI